jgi:hypothetical protein
MSTSWQQPSAAFRIAPEPSVPTMNLTMSSRRVMHFDNAKKAQ